MYMLEKPRCFPRRDKSLVHSRRLLTGPQATGYKLPCLYHALPARWVRTLTIQHALLMFIRFAGRHLRRQDPRGYRVNRDLSLHKGRRHHSRQMQECGLRGCIRKLSVGTPFYNSACRNLGLALVKRTSNLSWLAGHSQEAKATRDIHTNTRDVHDAGGEPWVTATGFSKQWEKAHCNQKLR